MKAEERKELEQNTLVKDTRLLVEGVKSGKFLNYRIIGLVLAVAVVGGVWWYAIRQSRSSTSDQWAGLSIAAGSPSQLDTYAEGHQKDLAGKVARLNLARHWFGPEGVAQLNASDPELRTKGIDSIQKARDEFVKLADELKGDKTLRASALLDAAGAELGLVGIPKAVGSSEERGAVAKAVEFYRQAAATVGDDTEYGGKLKEKADKLEKDAAEIHKVAQVLYNPLTPTTSPHGFGSPKAPSSLDPSIPAPKNPAETPKAPENLTPPGVTPPEAKKEAAPPPLPTPTTSPSKK